MVESYSLNIRKVKKYGFKTLVSETFVGLYSVLAAKLAF
jgi:hypothetical protein